MQPTKITNPAVSPAVPMAAETLGELINQLAALESEMVEGAANALGHRRRWRRSVDNYRAELASRMGAQGIAEIHTGGPSPFVARLSDGHVTVAAGQRQGDTQNVEVRS